MYSSLHFAHDKEQGSILATREVLTQACLKHLHRTVSASEAPIWLSVEPKARLCTGSELGRARSDPPKLDDRPPTKEQATELDDSTP